MDVFEGPGRLDWWANESTLLFSVEVAMVIRARDDGWDARGHITEDGGEGADGLAFFCEFDPRFDLRFADGSYLAVVVHPGDGDAFTLSEDEE